jgi:hypothetical protein
MADTTTTTEETLSVKASVQQANGYTIYTYSWSGLFEKVKERVEKYPLGKSIDNDGEFTPDDKLGGGIVCASQCTRREGNLGDATISVCIYDKSSPQKWLISLDSLAVPKNIRTWEPQEGDPPDLVILGRWEATADKDPELYKSFKYQDDSNTATSLTDNTLELAKMIYNGINSYTVHAPSVTASFADPNTAWEFVENLDKQYTTQELATLLNERRMDTTDWDNFLNRTDAEKWLLTDCKIAQQANGISQVTLRWIGGTKIEEKLYPTKS